MTAGQACVAATRMLVPQDARTRCSKRSQHGLRGDHGRAAHRPARMMGPVISAAPARALRALRRAGRGARRQGRRRRRPAGRPWTGATTSSRPCSTCRTTPTRRRRRRSSVRSYRCIGYRDLDDAVRIANDSVYGLSAQVYGADVAAGDGGGAAAPDGRGQRQHRQCSAPTRRAAATSRAASAANGVPTASAPSRRSSTWRSANSRAERRTEEGQ